jgi:hypothetical protein
LQVVPSLDQIAGLGKDPAVQRLANRVQLTSDGHRAYLDAVEEAFGDDVDYPVLQKLYGTAPEAQTPTARRSASASGLRMLLAIPIRSTSVRATSSART